MELRQYQKEAIGAIKLHFTNINKQYIELPTGAGKTFTFLSFASSEYKKVLVIVPARELLKQVYESAQLFYHPSEISRKGHNKDEEPEKLHICIINSIRPPYLNRLLKTKFDLIIIDEAHHAQAKSYRHFISVYEEKYPNTKFLGVTATPDRSDGQILEENLNRCTFKLTLQEMIDEGHLCDIEGYSIKSNIDLSDTPVRNNEFSLKDLYKKLSVESRNNLIVDIYLNQMKERKTLIFCINIAHSKSIFELLKSKNIPCAHIDGSMNQATRQFILQSFRSGLIKVICNCQLLTEGFDEPSIDGILLARPTLSRSLFLQMIGRGLRKYPGKKNCKIIDIIDNHKTVAGFNSILTDLHLPHPEKFESLEHLKEYVGCKELEITEFSIKRTNLLQTKLIEDQNATDSMIKYLEDNNIKFYEPLSFDEGSFMVWFNELKKEYQNGYN